jgi:RNA polymerase sigma-70 factor (ECF subfamily)
MAGAGEGFAVPGDSYQYGRSRRHARDPTITTVGYNGFDNKFLIIKGLLATMAGKGKSSPWFQGAERTASPPLLDLDPLAQDRAMVQRLLAGHEQTFDSFFSSYFPRLFRFALVRLNNDPDEAEEAAQVALCQAVAELHTYRGEAMLFTWLCTICRHEIFAMHRRKRRIPRSLNLMEDGVEVRAALESLAALSGPHDELQRKELARLVQVTLDWLPSHYGDALEWKYSEGLSVKEIASRLGIGAKAAESLLTRARQAFRDGFSSITRSPDAGLPSMVKT